MQVSKKIYVFLSVLFVFSTANAQNSNYDIIEYGDGAKVAEVCYGLEQMTKHGPVDTDTYSFAVKYHANSNKEIEGFEFTSNTEIRSLYDRKNKPNMPVRSAMAISCRYSLDYIKQLLYTYPGADGEESFEAVANGLTNSGNREEYDRLLVTVDFLYGLRALEEQVFLLNVGGQDNLDKVRKGELSFRDVVRPVSETSYLWVAKSMGVIDTLGALQFFHGGADTLMTADMSQPIQKEFVAENQATYFKKSPKQTEMSAAEVTGSVVAEAVEPSEATEK